MAVPGPGLPFFTVAIALAFLHAPALASADADPRRPEEMAEVQVLASRLKLTELRAEIARTEDEFYRLLNTLMDDPEMEVTCETGPPLGTHIQRRVCGPQFVASANAAYGRDMIQGLSLAASGGTYIPPVPPDLAIATHEGTFQRKVLGLVNGNAALRELAQRRQSLEVLYKAAQKARFKGRVIATD